jgi:hypothetical protein
MVVSCPLRDLEDEMVRQSILLKLITPKYSNKNSGSFSYFNLSQLYLIIAIFLVI